MKHFYVILVILIILFFYILVNVKNSSITNNHDNSYTNKSKEYSFTYPTAYTKSESAEGDIYLAKDQQWDNGDYNLQKGALINLSYRKNINLNKDFVKDDLKQSFDSTKDGKVIETSIEGKNVIEATYSYNISENFPYITVYYLKDDNNILKISFALGKETSIDEYIKMKNEFKSITKSIDFAN